MQDLIEVKGMVLKAEPIGEYDRRIVILTDKMGKLTCFSKGARRVGSRFMAATNPFCFGTFRLYPGRNSYSLNDVLVSEYFIGIRDDFEKACYGMYFLELADYYTLENSDDLMMLKLLYQSVRALLNPSIPDKLIKCIFEIKAISVNGEYPGVPNAPGIVEYDRSTLYTMEFITNTPVERLYTFTVNEKVLSELVIISDILRDKIIDRKLKSLEILNTL